MLWPAALLLVSAQAASSGSARIEQVRRQLQATGGGGGARLEQMRRRLQDAPPPCPACDPGWSGFVAGMDRLQAATDVTDPFAIGAALAAQSELACAHAEDLRCVLDQGCATEAEMGPLLSNSGCYCDACPGSAAVQGHLMTMMLLAFSGMPGSDFANVTMPTEEEIIDMTCPLLGHMECQVAAPACQAALSGDDIRLNASDLEGRCGHEQGPTCGEVRREYRDQACCGNPNKEFHAPGSMRRLQAGVGAGDVAEKVGAALRRARAKGGAAEAKALARRVRLLLDSLTE